MRSFAHRNKELAWNVRSFRPILHVVDDRISNIVGGPKRLLEVPIGFFCLDVLLHEFGDHLVFVDEFLTEFLDLLLLELGDLGLGHFRHLLRLGCFLEGPLDVIECHGDPLMDLSRLDRQLFRDCGNRFFAFEVPPNDGRLLLSCKFST